MSVFSAPDFDDHERVVFCCDAASGLKAIVAVHNTNLGPALGGIRMWPYPDEDSAVADALRLARTMAYKSGILKMPYGGAKAVIIGDPKTHKTDALLEAMGRFVDRFQGQWITGEDVNIGLEDIEIMRRQTRYCLGSREGSGDPSPVTAYGVYQGIRAAAKRALGVDSLDGVTVAVQGLGKVGYALCAYLHEESARLIVADMDAERVNAAAEAFGAVAVGTDDIYDAEADIYAPCALGATLNDDTIPRLRVKAVAGAANSQLAEARHGAALAKRGILYAPDYLINSAGYMNIVAEINMLFNNVRYDRESVLKDVRLIYDRLLEVFARAEAEGVAPDVACDREAEAYFKGGAQPNVMRPQTASVS